MQQIIVNIDESGSKEQDDLVAMVHHLSHGQGSCLGNENGVESPHRDDLSDCQFFDHLVRNHADELTIKHNIPGIFGGLK